MASKKVATPATEVAIAEKHSIKGFDANLACRGYQFAIGQTYEHEGTVRACSGGFHACDTEAHPLEVFNYYPPASSRYCDVVQSGEMHSDDQIKIASAKITIGVEISLHELIGRAVKYVFDRCTQKEGEHATGYQGAASATGYQGAASATGYQGAASATGDLGAASATGDLGAASATGYRGAASATGTRGAASATGTRGAASATGYQGAASATGDLGAASATGYRGAASATGTRGAASATGTRGAASATGTRGAASATGYQGAASATGYQGAASATGYQGAASATGDLGAASATGYRGAASATGTRGAALSSYEGKVRGSVGNALFAIERDADLNIISVAAGIVGLDGILADAWYCCRAGKLVLA